MMLNYFVGEGLLTQQGSGISAAISDHIKLMRNIGVECRLVVYLESAHYLHGDFGCEIIYTNGSNLTTMDGIWYVQNYHLSLILSDLGINHLCQLHNGDCLLDKRLNSLRPRLFMRDYSDVEEEIKALSLPTVTVVSQTQSIADELAKLGVKSLVARLPCYRNKVEADKVYDLVITGSITPLKGLSFALRTLEGVKGKKIAVICAIGCTNVRTNRLTTETLHHFKGRLGIPFPEELEVDWYFGARRDEVNEILARAKRVAHPSLVECYPFMVMEASQYTTVYTNKHALYPNRIGIETKQIDFGNLEELFGEILPPALDLNEHNLSGEKEWTSVIQSMKSLA